MKKLNILIFLSLSLSIVKGQYQNGMDAIRGGFYGTPTLTPQKEKRMEKEIENAIAQLRTLKRYTNTNGLDYTDVASFSWYPVSGGGVGRYKLNQEMFDQVKRSWFTDVTINRNVAFSPNVDFDSSVVGYSLFVGWASEKYFREHKNDKLDSVIVSGKLDSNSVGWGRIFSQKEIEEMRIEQIKQKEEHRKEIARRTFKVMKFIDKHHVLIDRVPNFETEELHADFKPSDYIEGLCNCYLKSN